MSLNDAYRCPSPPVLLVFALGKADLYEDAIADHVAGCADCFEFLEAILVVAEATEDRSTEDRLTEDRSVVGWEVEADPRSACGECGSAVGHFVWTVDKEPVCGTCMRSMTPKVLWPLVSAVERVLDPDCEERAVVLEPRYSDPERLRRQPRLIFEPRFREYLQLAAETFVSRRRTTEEGAS